MLKYFHQFSWAAPATWPDDIGEFVFLARAVETTGKQIFSSRWTGSELALPEPPDPLPFKESWADWIDRAQAHDLLTETGLFPDLPTLPISNPSDSSTQSLSGASAHLSRRRLAQLEASREPDLRRGRFAAARKLPCIFSAEQWAVAIRLQEQKRELLRAGRERLKTAQIRVAEAIAFGQIVGLLKEEAALIPSVGLDAGIWNTNHHDGLRDCAITVNIGGKNPYIAAVRQRLWIFVTRESLEAFKQAGQQTTPAAVKTHIAGRKQFAAWFRDVVAASPEIRSLSKADIVRRAQQHQLSGRDAIGIRDQVLGECPDAVYEVWTRQGRPKKKIDTERIELADRKITK